MFRLYHNPLQRNYAGFLIKIFCDGIRSSAITGKAQASNPPVI
jgi:hypothetical protein